jgi:hypothetical protein
MAGSECVSGGEDQMTDFLNGMRNEKVVVYRSTYTHERKKLGIDGRETACCWRQSCR